MKYLNCGCGQRFHPAWVNIDSIPHGDQILVHDLRQGIPFPDESFDVVYHSHLLEHLTKIEAIIFMQDCFRVLQQGGIIRVAVPDLEQIVRIYLIALDQADAGSMEWSANYEWMMLELYDQTVRHYSGGEMAAYLFQEHILNPAFILERIGQEAQKFLDNTSLKRKECQTLNSNSLALRKYLHKIIPSKFLSWLCWRELLVKNLLGVEYSALQIGRFRQCGEIHQWMYDHYSLRILLQQCGFVKIRRHTAIDSDIYEWPSFHLDVDHDGFIYKPDSLYMEAVKLAKNK